MKTLKKNNISQWSSINSPVPVNKDCELPPFFNEDYFGHVVVQTIEELNSIPCKLRQDGMLATVVQDSYAEWQLQSSRIGFSKCDNRSWVKINSGDTFYDGSNLFIFSTQAEADIYKSTPAVKEGQVIYIIETNTYFKYDGQDAYVDPFPNKLTVPTEDGVEGPDYKVPAYLADGVPYWRSTKDFGKVKSVNNKIGDVILKTSDLENDSDYTTNALLNKKLNKPTTNNTNQFVILGDGSTAPKNDFGKVDTVNKIEPDSNKNVNLGIDDILPKGMPLEETLDYNKKVLLYDDTGKSYWKSLSEVGKVKTVNNQEPDENGNIKIEEEFVKNGGGWSLKYRVDNPTFYGAIGDKAIDISYTTSANKNVSFPYGAVGMYSFTTGFKNSVLGLASTVLGASNSSSGQTNHIISYRSTITEDRGIGNVGKHSNGIFAGESNTISDNIQSVIVGGITNKIVGNPDAKSGAFSKANVIIGGWNNEIFSSSETNRPAYSSFILGGELNKAQGYYNIVGGYSNHAVTAGETLFGFYGTVQNTSLNGYDYIENSRMFNVGVGLSQTNGTIIRRDGLSVFRNGLVTTPTASNNNIENNLKAVTTKEFVDNKISNFSLPTNWTDPSQRFSGLLDKSADATYNQLLGVDSNGYVAKVGLNAVTNAVVKSTDAQKEAFRVASRKSTENYNTSAPIILIANPFLIKNINNYPVNLVITGNNLFIDKVSSSLQIRRIKDVNGNPISDVWIDVTSSINVSEINNSLLAIYHNFKSFPAGYYEMKLTNQIGLSNLTSPLFMIVDNYEDTPTNAFEVISNSGNLLSQSTIGYNSTETTIISGLNGGMIFKDLVDIVDGNVNSITTIEISHTNPSTDYDMGEIVAGFTDQAIITPITMPIVGVKAFYKDWSVRCSDVKNNKDLGISGLGQNNQLNIFKIHLFIKDGTYSILSESHSKVSEGFYTDLSKLNFMLNITRSTSYNRTAPFTASITSFKKIN